MRLPPPFHKILDSIRAERREEFRALRKDIQQLINAVRDEQQTQGDKKQQEKFNSEISQRITRIESGLAEYSREDEKTYRNLEIWAQYLIAGISLLALGAVIVYAGITALQWRTMNKSYIELREQTEAAKSAAQAAKSASSTATGTLKLTQESIALGQRPWVGMDPSTKPEFKFNFGARRPNIGDSVAVDVDAFFTLRNYGSTPALYVSTFIMAATTFDGLKTASDGACSAAEGWYQQKGAERKSIPDQKVGFALFPGQTYREQFDTGASGERVDAIFVTGCIVYGDSERKKHTTRFCEVARSDGTPIGLCNVQNTAD